MSTPMRFPLEIWNTDAERLAVLTKALELAGAPMALVDPLGNVVYVTPPAETLWGEPAAALLNRAVVSLLGLDETRAEADAFGTHLESGQPWTGPVKPRGPLGFVTVAGETAHARIEPVFAPTGAASGADGSASPAARILALVVIIRTSIPTPPPNA